MADPNDVFGDGAEAAKFDGGAVPIVRLAKATAGNGLEIQFACSDLPKMDMMGKSDPQLMVYLLGYDETWQLFDKTEFHKDVNECTFEKRVTIPLDQNHKSVKIDLYDLDKFKAGEVDNLANHDLIGTATVAIRKLEDNPRYTASLYNAKLSGDAGVVVLTSRRV
eukprot:c41455_g1_i1.p2 GENE.c41455_g1_i1~~c41455_g1_i1.p2  ORF type:complete len:176 (-),score=49.65 c41455_g1_i1:53-547(-)